MFGVGELGKERKGDACETKQRVGPAHIAVVDAVASVLSVLAVVASVIALVTNDPIVLCGVAWRQPPLFTESPPFIQPGDLFSH